VSEFEDSRTEPGTEEICAFQNLNSITNEILTKPHLFEQMTKKQLVFESEDC